jgi:hypothetical protein
MLARIHQSSSSWMIERSPPKSSFSFFLVAGINVRLRHEPPLVKSSPKNILIFRQKKPARDDVTDIQIISCELQLELQAFTLLRWFALLSLLSASAPLRLSLQLRVLPSA